MSIIMDNSITNISLLDCNSRFSEEKIGGNLAPLGLFTNKIGHGIKVNAGDKVSLQSAFVSELGAGEDSVEFSNELLEQRTMKYVKIVGNRPINGCNTKILGFESASAVETEFIQDNKGNSTNIIQGFYKSNNGENCFNLPRRFIYSGDSKAHTVSEWTVEDSVDTGRAYFNPCQIDKTRGTAFNGNFANCYISDADYKWYQTPSVGTADWLKFNCFKPKNDNYRFQIFVRSDTYYGGQTLPADNPVGNTDSDSPSNSTYLEYLDKLEISVPSGFSSLTAISESITSAFRKQSQPEEITIRSTANNYASTGLIGTKPQKIIPISTKINSSMYKTFFSASPATNSSLTYNAWTTWGGPPDGNDDLVKVNNALNYLSSHQYIGVKRPELFSVGRKWSNYLSASNGYSLPAQGHVNFKYDLELTKFQRDSNVAGSHLIVLDLKWNDKNLEYIRDICLEEELHPELFSNKYNQFQGFTTVNNSRFLHINVRNNSVEFFKTLLGGDNINLSGVNLNRCSVPIFFDYNPDYKNTNTQGENWEEGYSYGFAKRIRIGTEDFIGLTTEHMGKDLLPAPTATTIPTFLFYENNDDNGASPLKILKNTNFGFDTHFNAFGNVCIGLTSGWGYQMYHELERLEAYPTYYYDGSTGSPVVPVINPPIITSDFIQEIYLGADQPVCSYNTTTSRYEIAQLHTPEFVQNPYNAGGLNASGLQYISEVSTAGDRVFKINKRLNNGNFTPDMRSYKFNEYPDLTVYTKADKSASAKYQIELLNPNLEQWAIYDQLCGVIIKDFGYTLKTWDDGIWGIMGFTYNQFNAIRTSSNDLSSRVGNGNKQSLPFAFTNADINSGDTINFPTNCFGAGMYNLSLPATMSFNTDNGGGGANGSGIVPEIFPVQSQPAITSPQTSVILGAPNLPQKLLNGYFTIRSDILEEATYKGGFDSGQLYPVISIVDKINDTGNYFTQVDSSLEFTFTKPKVITSIQTSIHNPSQSLANVDRDSAVVYKITRQRPHVYDVVDQIINPPKKAPKKA